MATERIIGIDFGTSTTVIRVKRYQDGKPVGDRLETKPVTFNMGSTMVPTLIQKLPSGEAYFGYDADIPRRKKETFQNFKADIENPDEDIRRRARELTAEYFTYLAKCYQAQSKHGYLGEIDDKERTIISYPVKWSDKTKAFIIQTAKDADFPNVEGINEAQAVIQAVTVQNADLLTHKGYLRKGIPVNILLIDMGARTTDLVLCRFTPGVQHKTDILNILSIWPQGGDIFFGGREVDELLNSYIRQLIPEEIWGLVQKRVGIELFKFWKEAIVSPALQRMETIDTFPALDNWLKDLGVDEIKYSIDRDVFEGFAADYLRQFPELVNGCVSAARLSGDDVDLVILTGGHSQWYFVREMLSGELNRFGETGLGKIQADPKRIISITLPQETVALGLVYGALMESQIKIEPYSSMAERIIGVDFGTSTFVIRVKRYQDGKPVGDRLGTKPVTFNMGSTMVPTLIQRLPSGDAYYGYEAENPHKNTETFQNFKVDIENPDEAIRKLARKLTKDFFRYLAKEYIAQSEGGHLGEIDDQQRTIISYPVKWSDETKAFMVQTAKDAGFPHVEGVDEAQAAIQAVTVQNADLLTRKGYFNNGVSVNILLIDMGAGTTDLVLCRHTPGAQPKTDTLSTWPQGGNVLFGGREVDELLNSYIRQFIPKENWGSVQKRVGLEQFKSWKEDIVAPALQRGETINTFVALDNRLEDLEIDEIEYFIDRDVFESFAADYLRQFPELVNGCVSAAGLSGDDVDLVILTGGHSQWYFVREMLSGKLDQFGKIGLGKIEADPERIIPITLPQETVGLGLAYMLLKNETRLF